MKSKQRSHETNRAIALKMQVWEVEYLNNRNTNATRYLDESRYLDLYNWYLWLITDDYNHLAMG